MGIDERARHDLYMGLEELMGTERADALMGMLPPVGWADVATKHDLAAFEQRMDLRFDAMDLRFESLEERMDLRFEAMEHRFKADLYAGLHEQLRILVFAILAALAAMASLCIGAIALIR